MASKRPSKKKAVQATFQPRTSPVRPVRGALLVGVGLLLLVALADYRPTQEGFLRAWATSTAVDPDPNLVGRFGRDASFLLLSAFGLGAWFPLFALLWVGLLQFLKRAHLVTLPRVLVLVLATLGASGLANTASLLWFPGLEGLFPPDFFPRGTGGAVGFLVNEAFLYEVLGTFGSVLVQGVLLLLGFAALFSDPSRNLFERAFQRWSSGAKERREARREKRAAKAAGREDRATRRERREAARAERRQRREARATRRAERRQRRAEKRAERERRRKERSGGGVVGADTPEEAPAAPRRRKKVGRNGTALPEEEEAVDSALLSGHIPRWRAESRTPEAPAKPPPEEEPAAPPVRKRASRKEPAPSAGPAEGDREEAPALRIVAGEKVEKARPKTPARRGNYHFPSIDRLEEPAPFDETSAEDHAETARSLQRTLADFGLKVDLGEVHTGPVITRYEVYPAPGVKVERIANLANNLGMSLKAQAVRILAPVPGKGCVGIEVPNRRPSPVHLREIIESKAWVEAEADIPLILGKEVSGKPLVTDLARMPHLLIAGATGSGKTVCLNSVIASLLYRMSPEDLRFLMIDPKIVEMQMYNRLPHMLVPVVTDPKKVPGALKWLIGEMERRYRIFARANVRNIAGFNGKILRNREERKRAEEMDASMSAEERAALLEAREGGKNDDDFEMPTEKMPYIVCVVDELADLMMVAPADIETGIARLAQLARAAGIHLVLATQRPSVNVVTGVIKANLPSRIAFKTASKVDSRTILDENGADALIGRGDMLFLPPGAHSLVRAQGALVSDDEINGIVEELAANGPPDIDENAVAAIESGDGEEGGDIEGDFEDDLVPKALEVIRSSRRASTSMLQRRLKIGYNRAARIMEILEDEGYVGPENGAQPREILTDSE